MTYTIRFPYKHPDLTVRGSGRIVPFSEVPDGALFRDIDLPGRIYEKLGTDGVAACLLPWEYQAGVIEENVMCEIMERVRQ